MQRVFILFLSLLLVGCCHSGPLIVRHEYLDPRYLASSYVDTPDPRRCNFYGQQLIINWALPKAWMRCPDLALVLRVRYGVEEVEEVRVPIRRRGGVYVYRLTGDCYCEKEGILTYKVEIRSGDNVLETWNHQVWAQLIEFEN